MFTLTDTGRLLLAVLACGVVIALPGIVLARLFRSVVGVDQPFLAVVLGLAVLPLVDSLTTRAFGLDVALALTAILASVSIAFVRPRLDMRALAPIAVPIAIWGLVLVVEWVDVDVGGKLYQSFTVIDTVKHAATTQAILDTGAPPRDPFFLRSQPVSYYYFFYILPALAERLCAGLIDAKAAVGGAIFWTGLGLYGLVGLAIRSAALVVSRRAGVLTLAILFAGGLDIIGIARMALLQDVRLADPVAWNEQVTNWIESLLWVPHHVTGLIAATLGLTALCAAIERPVDRDGRTRQATAIGLAALCLASALGLSIWITFGLVVTVGLWCGLLTYERRWRAIGLIALAGGLAIVLALPQLLDLHAGRSFGGPPPIVPTVRAFSPTDGLFAEGAARTVARFFALPLNYFAGFGVLASGTILFWRDGGGRPATEFGRVLVVAAVAGLLLGAFLKSTLFNNDLGWRVVLFPMLAGAVWTIVAMDRVIGAAGAVSAWRAVPRFTLVLLGLGWATSAYALVGLRAYPVLANDAEHRFMSEDPATERALRVAYGWADVALPRGMVLQHDPGRPRAFAFALYGRHPTAVSDAFGSLFGADSAAVDARLDALAPLFRVVLPAASVRAVATAAGIDALVVTAADPVWRLPDAFVWHVAPLYASDRVRIVPVKAIGAAPADLALRRDGAPAHGG